MVQRAMREIPLTKGKTAIVDPSDWELVSEHRWYALKRKSGWHAIANVYCQRKRTSVTMHRLILGLRPGDGVKVGHRNGNGLDNRRANLRVISRP
jgi:hypothetical protein